MSAACNRVSVIDGHTECVSVKLGADVGPADLIETWRNFEAEPQRRDLPTAPHPVFHYLDDPASPQARLHRDLGSGMAVAVGRVRTCPLLGFKFVTLSHNTVRGAAGGSILLAELAVSRGLVPGISRG